MKPASISLVLGLALISGGLLAATTQGPNQRARHEFQGLDANGDAQISASEAKSFAGLARNFSEFDRNHDGELSWKEFLQHARMTEVNG